jgi:hypothetical protein
VETVIEERTYRAPATGTFALYLDGLAIHSEASLSGGSNVTPLRDLVYVLDSMWRAMSQ